MVYDKKAAGAGILSLVLTPNPPPLSPHYFLPLQRML
jgi:hypothetical protein